MKFEDGSATFSTVSTLKHVAFIRIHAPCFISLFVRIFLEKNRGPLLRGTL
jgi:hypothetical protein